MTVITDVGIEATARLINGVSPPDPFRYISTGTGATAPLSTNTTLEAENATYGAGRAIAACSFSSPGTSQWTYNFVISGGTVVIREIGIHNAASGGDMLLRGILSENKTLADGEAVEITITNTMVRVDGS